VRDGGFFSIDIYVLRTKENENAKGKERRDIMIRHSFIYLSIKKL